MTGTWWILFWCSVWSIFMMMKFWRWIGPFKNGDLYLFYSSWIYLGYTILSWYVFSKWTVKYLNGWTQKIDENCHDSCGAPMFAWSSHCGKALQHQMGDSSKVDRLLFLACYANSIKELSTTYQHLLNCGPFSAPNLSPGDGPRPGPRRGSVALPLRSRPRGRTADCDSIAATESEKHGCDGYDATWHELWSILMVNNH